MDNKKREQQQRYIRLINQSEDYIEQHLSTPISLKELADNANFSEYHFHRIFKQYSNETLKQFITRFKLERAAIFLSVNQSLSLTDIALSYGYNDSSTFSKAFKNHFGVSPSAYRKEQETTRVSKKYMT
ncbi:MULTISPECIES: AraC family transcriptional regulator [Vagococcus]|uniref:Transcriptional regulator, AraC family n=1 Tax=Vagococcus fluvialis bH819 TaxID=1255619 RepID=A0A1X6WPQ3_9ENTE|nr:MULTISPECIES: AraC family transcriptional regulator [Vagococcus]SLM86259.1 Transcriptional regulator, AraC family [Vagococcus fluvialis bH819]HCM88913.1 AraC family transcriptional regulator [Vagococcus sp.]